MRPLESVEFDGVVGFVDLSGFTAAAERLGKLGPRGTEQLGRLINTLFTPAIDIIHDAGGEIGWFAGDAIGALFDCSVTGAVRAVASLAETSDVLSGLPPMETDDGPLKLSVKVGAAAGPVRWNTIGSEHRLSWFGGPPIDRASDAEGHTGAGQIVLHESLFADMGDDADLSGVAPGFALLTPPTRFESGPRIESPLAERRHIDHQPPRVARRASAGNVAFLDEHRPVTVLFMGMPEPVHDADELIDIRAIVEDLGGLLQAATEGDKGALVLALFGVPTALADRQARAVVAAERLRARIPGARLGLASGRLFCGRVGSEARWDYSVVGDRVNTAARLLQAAATGEVLVDRATADGAGPTMRHGSTRHLRLKGKSQRESVVALDGVRERVWAVGAPAEGGLFVGRRAETALLLDRFAEPGLTVVVAPAGGGKSRLLRHAAGLLVEAEPEVVVVDQTDRVRPFGLWQRLLPALLGRSDGLVETLPPRLRDDPRLPLLGPILGLSLPETTLTASVGADDRPELMASLVLDLIDASLSSRPIAVEDLHWCDDASVDLLARVASRMADVGRTIVATSRDSAALRPITDLPAVVTLDLPVIDDGSMAELVEHLWSAEMGTAPTRRLRDELVERAGGSPLFCEQLVSYARAQGVPPAAEGLPPDLGVPVTLTDLVLARLDALPEEAMTVASYSAVLGRTFVATDVLGAFDRFRSRQRIGDGLEILRDQGVIGGLHDHWFTHSLFAETAYERMTYGLRADLHLAVLEHLEETRPGELDELAADLARHAEATDDADRKRRYFRVAADQAAERYANDVSRHWYEELVPLLEGAERGDVDLRLGRIESVAGELETAARHLNHAIKSLEKTERAPAEVALARVLVMAGSPEPGFDRLDAVIDRCRAVAAWTELHDALEVKADLATMLGDVERAEEVEAVHTDLIDALGTDHEAAVPIRGLLPLLWLRGDLEAAAREYERLHTTLRAEGDLSMAGTVAADLAGIHYERNDVQAMFVWLERARGHMKTVGNQRSLVAHVQCNEVEVRTRLGDDDGAFSLAVASLDAALGLGSPIIVGSLLLSLGRLREIPDRVGLLERSVVLASSSGNRLVVADAVHGLALALFDSGSPDRAIELMQALSSIEGRGHDQIRLDLAVCRARRSSDADRSVADELVILADELESVELQARALAALAQVTSSAEQRAEALERCVASFRSFPTAELAATIELLDGARPPLLSLPAVQTEMTAEDLADAMRQVDRMPALADWRHDVERLLDGVLANAASA